MDLDRTSRNLPNDIHPRRDESFLETKRIFNMKDYRFYKEGLNWYVDLPEWTGSKSDLIMIGGADTMLDILSNNGTEVITTISEEEFEGASKLEYQKLADDIGEGAYYLLASHGGVERNLSVFLCDVTLFVFGKFPQTIYILPVEEKIKMKVAFGLVAQGHIPTIERMISEYSAKSEINKEGADLSHSGYLWDKIAKEIGWLKETAMLYYIRYLRTKESSINKKVMRDLVDNVWQDAKESEEVPSTAHADKLIDKTLEQQTKY